jgi:hypothetical protein
MNKKITTLLLVAVIAIILVCLYHYFGCKISCLHMPEMYMSPYDLDISQYHQATNLPSEIHDPNICTNGWCKASSLKCTNEGQRCAPMHECTTSYDICCRSGSGITGFCLQDPELPCYTGKYVDCDVKNKKVTRVDSS